MSTPIWPTINASLNAGSAVLVVIGFMTIRKKRIGLHVMSMLGACLVSLVFLISYILYHFRVGSVHFEQTGWIRPVYFGLLISHTVLALVVGPLILRTILLSKRDLTKHVSLGRWTLPLWLYVSATGVLVYWLLYHLA